MPWSTSNTIAAATTATITTTKECGGCGVGSCYYDNSKMNMSMNTTDKFDMLIDPAQVVKILLFFCN